jgi:hypothetical protein
MFSAFVITSFRLEVLAKRIHGGLQIPGFLDWSSPLGGNTNLTPMESNPFEIIQFDHALDARQIPKSISGGPLIGNVTPRGEHFVSHSHKSSV